MKRRDSYKSHLPSMTSAFINPVSSNHLVFQPCEVKLEFPWSLHQHSWQDPSVVVRTREAGDAWIITAAALSRVGLFTFPSVVVSRKHVQNRGLILPSCHSI